MVAAELCAYMQELNYKDILDSVSQAVCVAALDKKEDGSLLDCTIEYVNDAFKALTQSRVLAGMTYTSCGQQFSQEVDWPQLAAEALGKHEAVQCRFYSILCARYLTVSMNRLSEDRIVLVFIDISQDKENELQLKRQNIRLASLTEELSTSQTHLRSELNSIQTLNEQLRFAAYHDTLTNLHNRAWFNKCLAECIAFCKEDTEKSLFGILLLGVDNMRTVNEAGGHKAGDELLRQTAVVLRRFESNTVTAFRFSGDEFILLKSALSSQDEMASLGSSVLRAFNDAGIHISGGITLYPDDAQSGDDLLKFADMAKLEVKRNGKNGIAFFKPVMQENFMRKLRLESKLSKAMDNNVFELYFQPQFEVNSGNLRGFEALLRWHDTELGWISPEHFIPLAEESRLVIPLGDWVLDTALSILSEWETQFNFDGIISVNVSPVQFKKEDFLERLVEKITMYGVNVSHLEIEITEGMLIDDVDATVEKLNKIHAMGIGISLDDFGTGYSSLRYLQILPLTTLKIDKSFVSNISTQDSIEANITESIVTMVSKMGLDTIAEGVETDAQLTALKKMNCHNVQGFLKGKPMPVSLCERMLGGDNSAILTINS